MNKAKISNVLRQLKLIYLTDLVRFHYQKQKHKKANNAFLKKYPKAVLPPDYLMYESFQLNYEKYYNGGLKMANTLATHFKAHTTLKNKTILDWGCGPGRIIRHMPQVVNNDCIFFGTDYNEKSIAWCQQHLSNIQFNKNELVAKLPYATEAIDVIYGISIFTHLSEDMHYQWFRELYRVLKPNGIMLLSLQGDNFKIKLSPEELKIYNSGKIVVRGNVKEGHRTYSAFHPKPFVKSLFKDVTILEHIEKKSENKDWVPQDFWIVRK